MSDRQFNISYLYIHSSCSVRLEQVTCHDEWDSYDILLGIVIQYHKEITHPFGKSF